MGAVGWETRIRIGSACIRCRVGGWTYAGWCPGSVLCGRCGAMAEINQLNSSMFLRRSHLSNLEVDRSNPCKFQRVAEFEVVGGTKGAPSLRK